MKAVVLAAGMGNRLRPLTNKRPKPMIPVINRPVMEHIIHNLRHHGIHTIFCNLHYRAQDIKAYFGDGRDWGASIVWREQTQLTGPAGGFALFDDLIDSHETVIVVSGDAIHDVNISALVEFHHQHQALLSVVMKRVPNPGRFGVGEIDEQQRIVSFKEKPSLDTASSGLVSCGIYCVSGRLLAAIPRDQVYDFGADLIPLMASREEAVFCFETQSYWCDVGQPLDLWQANQDALRRCVNLEFPGEQVQPGIFVEHDVVIEEGVKLTPPIMIGTGAHIGCGASIEGPSVVGHHAIIGKEAYIRQALVMDNSEVPPKHVVLCGIYDSL